MWIENQQKFMVPGVRSRVKYCILPEKIINEIIQQGNMNLRRYKYHYLHMTLQILSHITSLIAVQYVVCKVQSSEQTGKSTFLLPFVLVLQVQCCCYCCCCCCCCCCRRHIFVVGVNNILLLYSFSYVLNFSYIIPEFHILSLLIVGIENGQRVSVNEIV